MAVSSRAAKQTPGLVAAFGKRRPNETRLRTDAFRVLRLAGKRRDTGRPDYLEFVPEVRSVAEFSDLSTRVNCYLGDAGIPLYLPGPRFPLKSDAVPYFEESLVSDPGWLSTRPDGRPLRMVHRVTPAVLGAVARSLTPTMIVAPRLHMASELEYFRAREKASWPTYAPIETAMARLRAIANPGGRAFILATGPSALDADLDAVDAGVRITCNSAVRDLDRIRAFRPNIIACTDPVFHIGPSRYASAFRSDLVRAAEEVDALVLSGSDWAGPLLGLCPQLADRLVVFPFERGGAWRWPTGRDPTVRPGTSVLTNLMLPAALMLADEVDVAGADGRQPSENYFWKHDARLQYSDELMQTVFDGHPAFFRDRDYADYYDGYCEDIEALARAGEAAGKVVRGVTGSWIPALRRRGAPEPPS